MNQNILEIGLIVIKLITMKKITANTLLKQGEKTYKSIKGFTSLTNIVWYDDSGNIIAQSEPKLDGVPVVNLDMYARKLAKEYQDNNKDFDFMFVSFLAGYNSNPNQYSLADIDKACKLAMEKCVLYKDNFIPTLTKDSFKEIENEINAIQLITVDEQFNILSYE
jgi:hypothetical protein